MIWEDINENKPDNEEEVIIAVIDGYTTIAKYYTRDKAFMNEFDQVWEEDEVEFWMEMPKHPTRG